MCGQGQAGTVNVWDRVDWSGTISDASIPFFHVDLTGEVEGDIKVQNYKTCAQAGHEEAPSTSYSTYSWVKLTRECTQVDADEYPVIAGDSASVLIDNEDHTDQSCYSKLTATPGSPTPPNVEDDATFEVGGDTLTFTYMISMSGDMSIDRGHSVRVRSDGSVTQAVAGVVIPYNGTTAITNKSPASAYVLK